MMKRKEKKKKTRIERKKENKNGKIFNHHILFDL